MPIINIGKHTIEVTSTMGVVTIKYDDEVKRKAHFAFGPSVYYFFAEEDGRRVTYDIDVKSGLRSAHVTVKRDGTSVFSS